MRPLATTFAEDVDLPVGSAPQPIAFDHFPDRLHAVVWRNWQIVRPSVLAQVLGTSADRVTKMAASMGLPPAEDVPPNLARRAYITVLRRNWHLLPYEQLLPLIGMSRVELAYSLREDDFLFVKLGNLKPQCRPLRYAEPDAAATARAAEIKATVESRFGAAAHRRGEPRFAFVDRIAQVPDGYQPPPRRENDSPRYLYSYFGSYGDPLADDAPDSYPDGLLARLSECGVNGVWLHVVLRQLAPGGTDFPEFGAGSATPPGQSPQARRSGSSFRHRRLSLHERTPGHARGVLHRQTRHGRRARGRPPNVVHQQSQGPRLDQRRARSCFSGSPRSVRRVHDHGVREPHQLCFARPAGRMPACKSRKPGEIIAEVNAAIAAGVHRSSPRAKVLAWDWGWPDSDAIGLLPRDVWLMSVSEWSLPIERGGVKNTVGEYSLRPRPGPRNGPLEARPRGAG